MDLKEKKKRQTTINLHTERYKVLTELLINTVVNEAGGGKQDTTFCLQINSLTAEHIGYTSSKWSQELSEVKTKIISRKQDDRADNQFFP